ncbi:hypothetical protein SeLEV6574_g00883 [Synchytrium endobioticum]|nr:hypothetical protein SeLEV6574_g00883 [Synchytrium endobioticum]
MREADDAHKYPLIQHLSISTRPTSCKDMDHMLNMPSSFFMFWLMQLSMIVLSDTLPDSWYRQSCGVLRGLMASSESLAAAAPMINIHPATLQYLSSNDDADIASAIAPFESIVLPRTKWIVDQLQRPGSAELLSDSVVAQWSEEIEYSADLSRLEMRFRQLWHEAMASRGRGHIALLTALAAGNAINIGHIPISAKGIALVNDLMASVAVARERSLHLANHYKKILDRLAIDQDWTRNIQPSDIIKYQHAYEQLKAKEKTIQALEAAGNAGFPAPWYPLHMATAEGRDKFLTWFTQPAAVVILKALGDEITLTEKQLSVEIQDRADLPRPVVLFLTELHKAAATQHSLTVAHFQSGRGMHPWGLEDHVAAVVDTFIGQVIEHNVKARDESLRHARHYEEVLMAVNSRHKGPQEHGSDMSCDAEFGHVDNQEDGQSVYDDDDELIGHDIVCDYHIGTDRHLQHQSDGHIFRHSFGSQDATNGGFGRLGGSMESVRRSIRDGVCHVESLDFDFDFGSHHSTVQH